MVLQFLSGVTGLIQRGGGAQGLANSILKKAKTRRSTMLVCFACGIAIFFDDYANTLIVGRCGAFNLVVPCFSVCTGIRLRVPFFFPTKCWLQSLCTGCS